MKNLAVVLAFFFVVNQAKSGVLVVEGKFQNKNIYVQNAYGGSGVGFCAVEVKVNGHITTDEVNSSSFEIDLVALQFKYGDKVTIEIIHKDFCKPFVLNAEDLKPRPTFEVTSMNVSSTGILRWTTNKESGPLPYIIEQYKWNKWVQIGTVDGLGTSEVHDYAFKVLLHSGENKFRVKQIGLGSLPKISAAVTIQSMTEKPNYALTSDYDALQFSGETFYELWDEYGVIKKGYGKEIKLDNMKKGKYYLCYDNFMTEIEKKKR
ncbi:MAG TPA: hypothetical protein VN026_02780 [Bacteroidia bacterium]|jgi:hypothetical protein|nr:hypothetical protein [Bacteroidia bacterium]